MDSQPIDLDDLLKTESESVEWKTSPEKGDDVLLPACALANDLAGRCLPGYVVYGVDKTGRVVGLDTKKRTLDEWQLGISNQLISTSIMPQLTFDLAARVREGRHLLVLTIFPAAVPPIVEVRQVAYVRKGTTTSRANAADLARLRERRPEHLLPFDARPYRVADGSDLHLAALDEDYRQMLEIDEAPESFPDREHWLANVRQLGQVIDDVFRPTPAALLVYGPNPQTYFPEAVIEFAVYGGTDVISPVIERKTISGSLPNQLDVLWGLLEARVVDIPAGVSGVRTTYTPNYLLEVLKELARNMVQHRSYEGTHAPARVEWYADRIEFSNPGGPFGAASEGLLGEHSAYRNPSITRELVALGYVERLGRGLRRARLLSERNGYPPPEFETDGFTRAIVRALT